MPKPSWCGPVCGSSLCTYSTFLLSNFEIRYLRIVLSINMWAFEDFSSLLRVHVNRWRGKGLKYIIQVLVVLFGMLFGLLFIKVWLIRGYGKGVTF